MVRRDDPPGSVKPFVARAESWLARLEETNRLFHSQVIPTRKIPWEPRHPLELADRLLAKRASKAMDALIAARSSLDGREKALLEGARLVHPFLCPDGLQSRIDQWCSLYSCARHHDSEGVRSMLGNRITPGLLPVSSHEAEHAAAHHANDWAYPHTPQWKSKYEESLAASSARWDRLRRAIHTRVLALLSERRTLCRQHDAQLLAGVSPALATEVDTLLDAIEEASAVFVEMSSRLQQEVESMAVLQGIWIRARDLLPRTEHAPPVLGADDVALVNHWAGACHPLSYQHQAMQSAREAELIAKQVYENLFGAVEDLSILQIRSPEDSRWTIGDLASADRIIDVKNARRSFSSPNSYSEHIVKRFKTSADADVVLSGFLSPYNGDDGPHDDSPVVWLGEVTRTSINGLLALFDSQYLNIDGDALTEARIPPWVFDYPTSAYTRRNEVLNQLRSAAYSPPRTDCHPSLLVLRGERVPTSPPNVMATEINALVERLNGNAPSRPLLFLHVLDRFCKSLRSGTTFGAYELREVFFPTRSIVLAKFADPSLPLSVVDPLQTVSELLDVLTKVARTCADKVIDFDVFRLRGRGVFQGKSKSGIGWRTIFAYCGGKRQLPMGPRVKCGQSPLFLGQDEPCLECGNLVCHTCGYCSSICPECAARQATYERWV